MADDGISAGRAPDPLVPSPERGLGEWSQRLSEIWQRSWRMLAAVFAVTVAAPRMAATVLFDSVPWGTPIGDSLPLPVPGGLATTPETTPVSFWVAVPLGLAALVASAVGWGGAIWAVTQQAVGLPATLWTALRSGWQRCLPLSGWYLLYLVLVAVGALLFVLPGLYVAVAGMLFSYVVVYERGRSPLLRSAALVHQGPLAVLGRVLLLLALAVTVAVAVSGLNVALDLLPVLGPGELVARAAVDGVAMVAVSMVLMIGLLPTYTQARARREVVTTPQLWRAAGGGSPGPEAPPGSPRLPPEQV